MVTVTVNGRALNQRLDLESHSPDGFEWGYAGSGPAQLALALLSDHLGDDVQALARYQEFKRAVIERLPREAWSLTSGEIEKVLKVLKPEPLP